MKPNKDEEHTSQPTPKRGPQARQQRWPVLSFDHKTYGSLFTLGEAIARFDKGIGQAVLDTEIR